MTSEKELIKRDEEPIRIDMGYPYDSIPKGYPNKISDETINKTIEGVLKHLKDNLGVEQAVFRDTSFINLGLNELGNRQNRKQSKLAFWFSGLSLGLSLLAFVFSIKAFQSSQEDTVIQNQQLDELKSMSRVIKGQFEQNNPK